MSTKPSVDDDEPREMTWTVCPLCKTSVQGSLPEHQYWSEACNAHRLFGLGFIGWRQAEALAARTCAERRLAAELTYVAATRSNLSTRPQHDTAADSSDTVPEQAEDKTLEKRTSCSETYEAEAANDKRQEYSDDDSGVSRADAEKNSNKKAKAA